MWPRGKAWVCKTLYDGSNPSVTSQEQLVVRQAIVRGAHFHAAPYFFPDVWELIFFQPVEHIDQRVNIGTGIIESERGPHRRFDSESP